MLRRRLDRELHGSDGFTSVRRVVAIGLTVGFFVVGTQMLTKAWFNGRILPGVRVADKAVGGQTLTQLRHTLQRVAMNYQLRLQVADQEYHLTPADLGVTYDVESTITSAYQSGRSSWLPPVMHQPIDLAYHLDRSALNGFAASVAAKVGTPPVDASVVVKAGQLQPVPDKSGWSIDKLGLERLVEDDVRSPGGLSLQLQPHEQVADIQAKALGPTIDAAKRLMATAIVLEYNGRTFAPTTADVGSWLAFVKQPDGLASKLVPQVDSAKLKNYVQGIANQLDVAPVNKKVTVENGISKVETEGVNGTAIDQDPLTVVISQAVMTQSALTFTITSHEVPFKTISTSLVSLDLGRYIEVNLSKQHLWVWQDHNVIYDSPVTSGATGAGLGTVTGLFSIYYKTTNTHLVGYQYGYDYDVPVKYWMPFYKGYGLHDAAWRNGKFGGPDYYYGGSHGCVNLPDAAAEFIYNWSTVGTPVWVHN
ncbi:MAG TPA: L,D-transpeptidase family protein [Candidatus Saccharimonadia bacterium]